MKNNNRLRIYGYLCILLVCSFYWILDSFWSYLSFENNLKKLIFREPASWVDTFFLNVSPYQVVSRLMVSFLFVVIGILIIEFLIKKSMSERKLRASEEKFRTLVTQTEHIIFMMDKNGTFLLSQGKGLSALGFKPDEVVGKSIFKLYEDYPEVIHSAKKALSGESVASEVNVDGIHFRIWYTPQKNISGDVIWVLGLSIDITKQKTAEVALIKSEKRYREAQRMGKVGNWEYDIKSKSFWCSEEARRIYGLPLDKENFAIDEIKMRIPEKEKVHQALLNLIEMKTPYDIEYEIRTNSSHSRKTTRSIAELQLNEFGKPIKVTGVIQDITEQKRAAIEKREWEKRIMLSQKMESISTLAGGIAHDFNNMLSVITGNISYSMTTLTEKDHLYKVLSETQEGAERAKHLTQQLLTFSKGGAPVKKITDLTHLIKESSNFMTRGSKSKCTLSISNDLKKVEADEGQLGQVIGNLILNASQAMPQGGLINFEAENIVINAQSNIPLPAGQYVKIGIEDQGIGISEKHLPMIFDPFFTTKQKGSGLGLATTYSIIQQHGGHITVHSKMGEGTTFTIYLPATNKEIHEPLNMKKNVHCGQGNILVMDDQEPILKMVGRMLNQMGYHAAFAIDGYQAIELYRKAFVTEKPFDLVILDLTVPGKMGGAKTISELLKIDPNVKAIVSSGYSNDPIMANYLNYGFCGVVPKPYTKNQLAEVLIQTLGKKT